MKEQGQDVSGDKKDGPDSLIMNQRDCAN